MSDIPNIILDGGGPNEMTVYTQMNEEILTKILTKINPPQSTANKASGPKDTRIVDLQRIEERFIVTGLIDESNKNTLKAIIKAGGVSNFNWEGEVYLVNYEKMTITREKTEDNYRKVILTCIVGVDI